MAPHSKDQRQRPRKVLGFSPEDASENGQTLGLELYSLFWVHNTSQERKDSNSVCTLNTFLDYEPVEELGDPILNLQLVGVPGPL